MTSSRRSLKKRLTSPLLAKFEMARGDSPTIALEEASRAGFYGLLARLFAEPPSAESLAALRELTGDESPLGQALIDLSAAARTTSITAIAEEFNSLFIGLTEGELRPYGSYYRAGFLHEKPLADLRHDLRALGVARSATASEPEDHIAALCETMFGLITGAFGAPDDLRRQAAFFTAHIDSWAPRFFVDLQAAPSAVFYRPLGRLGAQFVAIEAEAFAMLDDEAERPAAGQRAAMAGAPA